MFRTLNQKEGGNRDQKKATPFAIGDKKKAKTMAEKRNAFRNRKQIKREKNRKQN